MLPASLPARLHWALLSARFFPGCRCATTNRIFSDGRNTIRMLPPVILVYLQYAFFKLILLRLLLTKSGDEGNGEPSFPTMVRCFRHQSRPHLNHDAFVCK